MDRRFEVIILEDAMEFLDSLDGKAREKMLYIMDKAALFNKGYSDFLLLFLNSILRLWRAHAITITLSFI